MSAPPKGLDLKCSETLRDSPSPPPPPTISQSHPLPSSYFRPGFASTATPNYQRQHGSSAISSEFPNTAFTHVSSQSTTGSLLLPSDSHRLSNDDGTSTIKSATIDSVKGGSSSSKSSSHSAGGSLTFGLANVTSGIKVPSFPQSQPPLTSSHMFPTFPLATSAGTAPIWPLVQQHIGNTSHHLSPSKQAVFSSATQNLPTSPAKLQQGSTSATLPISLSSSKGQGGVSTPIRPLKVHVSTSRGPAVLQLQQTSSTAGSSASGKQSLKLLPVVSNVSNIPSHQPTQAATAIGIPPTRPLIASLPASATAIGMAPTKVPVLRPSPVHPVAAATAVLLSQLAPNAPAFGLVDPHNLQQHHLQAAAALLRSPLTNAGTVGGSAVLSHVITPSQHIAARVAAANDRSIVLGDAGIRDMPPTIVGGFGSVPATSAIATTSTPSSPSRPSILRKRPMDLANGGGSGSPKRSVHDSVAKRTGDKYSSALDSETRQGQATSTRPMFTSIELPEASNSNHSSSASTISASSAPETGNGHSANSSQVTITGSPSPRKRARKQQFNEFTSAHGYGSDDDVATPITSYPYEQVEEETVAGPTGVGGVDGRYYPSTTTLHRSQLSLFMPLVQESIAEDLCDSISSQNHHKLSTKSDSSNPSTSGVSQRASTSFDQLQQQIEQQRRHVPEYRPRPSLLSQYELSYDSKRFHFAVYDDVKVKDEKRTSVVELSNQKQIWQRICGWKLHLMAVQLDQLDKNERSNYDDLNDLFEFLNGLSLDGEHRQDEGPRVDEDSELRTLKEMALSNIQRVRVIREQLDESRKQLLSVFKHKANVEKLISKYTSKRPIRKKDRGRHGASDL